MTPAVNDRIRGCMLGAAIGDALGAAFEFIPSVAIEALLGEARVRDYRRGVHGSLLAGHPPGKPTDDTAMALSLAHALASDEPITPSSIAAAFQRDLARNGQFGDLFWRGAPGGATTRALYRLTTGADPADNGFPDDGGNGAAMRVHPVGCLADRAEAAAIAAMQARITHGHPSAVAAAQAVALIVHDAIDRGELSADPPDGVDDERFLKAWGFMHSGLKQIRGGRLPLRLHDVHMSGWETVAAAHAIALLFDGDPEGGIAAAAASGGDTDTVACMVGAMLGASCGAGALPARWIDRLNQLPVIRLAAEGLITRTRPLVAVS